MSRGVVMLGVVAAGCLTPGCFAPAPMAGLPCSTDGECPSGQQCDPDTATCVADPAAPDASGAADARGPDAPPGTPDARPDAAGVAPFGAPAALTAINSPQTDADASLTADGLELYFASSRTGTTGMLDIWVATRASTSAPFGAVTRVAELSSTANDDSPEVSPDGLELYLVSSRGGMAGIHDVYRSTRASRAAAWAMPVLDVDLSSAENEMGVVISADRRIAIIDRDAGATGRELYQRERAGAGAPWGPLVHLAALGSPAVDGAPAIDGTGLVIYFHSDRVTAGELDIYRATRASPSASFSAPALVAELDAPGVDDSNPWIAADDQTLLFDSNRAGGAGSLDLYMAIR